MYDQSTKETFSDQQNAELSNLLQEVIDLDRRIYVEVQVAGGYLNIADAPSINVIKIVEYTFDIVDSGAGVTYGSPLHNEQKPSECAGLSPESISDCRFGESLKLFTAALPNLINSEGVLRRNLEAASYLLGSSILPLLYGLLGASVFLMRAFLGRTLNDPVIRRLAATTILRLGLGAIAGLAIGWFGCQILRAGSLMRRK
jgi:hypothetical protein